MRSHNIVQIRLEENRGPVFHWVAGVRPLHHSCVLLLSLLDPPGPGHGPLVEAGHHGGDHAEQGDQEEEGEQRVVKQDQQLSHTHPANSN